MLIVLTILLQLIFPCVAVIFHQKFDPFGDIGILHHSAEVFGTCPVCEDRDYCTGMTFGAEVELNFALLPYFVLIVGDPCAAGFVVCGHYKECPRILIDIVDHKHKGVVEIVHLKFHPL